MNDEYYMKLALVQAKMAYEDGEVPVGCVVVSNDTVIAKGYNQVEILGDVTAHAEMIATTSAADYLDSKYLDECTMYVTLEPCVMCAGALAWSQLKKLVIGARDEKRGFSRLNQPILHPKTEVVFDVLPSESEKLLKAFFQTLRKIK